MDSKWINNLNIPNTIKILEENIRINLYDLGLGNGFLDIPLKP